MQELVTQARIILSRQAGCKATAQVLKGHGHKHTEVNVAVKTLKRGGHLDADVNCQNCRADFTHLRSEKALGPTYADHPPIPDGDANLAATSSPSIIEATPPGKLLSATPSTSY